MIIIKRLYYGQQETIEKILSKKFDLFKKNIMEIPSQGWVKTIRDFFGMTTTQLAKRLNVSQSRIVRIEQNEKNTKISTMERIAEAINCEFVYAFVPREQIDDIIYNQAKKKALKILNKVNTNMVLENQLTQNNDTLDELLQELLNNNLSRIWDEE